MEFWPGSQNSLPTKDTAPAVDDVMEDTTMLEY